eukprot:CAMPEP_0118945530 /NCGR_PEP_ID=MMETSP1169-20130426/42457_1 /TAXON_ID=36882 /ORGANISM="Pyramimonas obovata, Strain CCMP722" /LENGTH=155 /DNA_ID=CAMNT_0006891271 /DNA_START=51 /DNA_END=518 /DNA_ORIENTATION=-
MSQVSLSSPNALIGKSQDMTSLVGKWVMLRSLDREMEWDHAEIDVTVHNTDGVLLEATLIGKGSKRLPNLKRTKNRPSAKDVWCGCMCFSPIKILTPSASRTGEYEFLYRNGDPEQKFAIQSDGTVIFFWNPPGSLRLNAIFVRDGTNAHALAVI